MKRYRLFSNNFFTLFKLFYQDKNDLLEKLSEFTQFLLLMDRKSLINRDGYSIF